MNHHLFSSTLRRACLLAVACVGAARAQQPHRAILISFDGFSEKWLRAYSDSLNSPTLWRMFGTGV
jgi:hypothetical protein